MTKEDLLKPRYKVVSDWPDSPFHKGEILLLEWKENNGKVWGFERKGTPGIWDEAYLQKYPHLFRKMHWSSERKPGELPLYIGWINEEGSFNWVSPVVKWINTDNRNEPLSCIISFTNLEGAYEEKKIEAKQKIAHKKQVDIIYKDIESQKTKSAKKDGSGQKDDDTGRFNNITTIQKELEKMRYLVRTGQAEKYHPVVTVSKQMIVKEFFLDRMGREFKNIYVKAD